ncbi:MAG: UDP-N-acetylmuramate dehydrogenase [Bacteroidales bacterium]
MIYENISLKKYNTFGLNIKADRMVTFKIEENAVRFFREHRGIAGPILILGRGSNILFTADFHGTVIHPVIEGITFEERRANSAVISCGSGVEWDKLVESTVNHGLGGLENLSLIPGHVGAAPVQNIGAYGAEVRNTIEKVRAICLADGSVREFPCEECGFGYRDSIFKNELRGKYLITKVYFRLSTKPKLCLEYGSLKEEVSRLGSLSLLNVRKIVMKTRQSKLPDPLQLGSAGSFFKNPVITDSLAESLKAEHPGLPVFRDKSGGSKLPAGWLIEKCGWKGKKVGNTGVYERQALVLVNYGGATGSEIFDLSEQIRSSVAQKFGITLEREVEVL